MPAYPQESKTKYIMQKNRKRKQQKPAETETEAKSAKIINGIKQDPYPTHSRPTPEECRTIRDSLLALHGFPQEFAKYRKQRQDCSIQIDCDAHCGVKSEPEESVLDGLIKTVLSQNTTEVNSLRAFANLKSAFPTWEDVSCVLLFQLQQDDFPVDTHVFDIAKAIGWVPEVADRNKTYLHLNQRIPNELKFDLNCLLFTHGKLCRRCTKKGGGRQRKESRDNSCPLLNYCDNSSVKTINEVN
ncbi:hypothetical protein JCGZ_11524 [Jatropha curcas]|uniref:HhH-GPD domain-containing protein n=1 Tax=Jatropha curcas TaxID=180498 RepID=A0A067K800_JATCU|nr:hypothetical protein JCGZ_11524 [Jatropha curcas]